MPSGSGGIFYSDKRKICYSCIIHLYKIPLTDFNMKRAICENLLFYLRLSAGKH
jgi:hypothetical protein